jgi:phosphate transport system ATP-binding protein
VTDDVFTLDHVSVAYGSVQALQDVTLAIPRQGITALIGPSGCGKSTLLRSLNRLTDLVAGARLDGTITFDGADIHAPDVDLVDLRRRVGMVFQKPNAFPKSIFDNVAYGPRLHGHSDNLDERVRRSLERAGLWDEVGDDLARSATALSGGQQQRLVIARALAVDPEVILMDEPTASLDPVATSLIEELTRQLAEDYTIVLVTHDLPQAERISDRTAFFVAHAHDDETRHGELVEFGPTAQVFGDPADERTRAYVTGGRG